MNWTKEPAKHPALGTIYRHRNGLTLQTTQTGLLWTAGDENARGAFSPELSAMEALAAAIKEVGRRERGAIMRDHTLTLEQVIEAINDLHTGGLP